MLMLLGMIVVSRACIEDKKDARLLNGCITDVSAGGSIERCYCQGNLCNGSTKTSVFSAMMVVVSLLALYVNL